MDSVTDHTTERRENEALVLKEVLEGELLEEGTS